jgi:ABC-2 type transport system ATP-binding protein
MEHPRTIIISSHNLSELENVLSEMILIDDGNLIFYKEMDEVREMAFRAEGSLSVINEFAKSYPFIYLNDGMVNTFGVFEGSPNSKVAQEAKQLGLTISNVSPEDICVYVTSHRKEGDLECLWS